MAYTINGISYNIGSSFVVAKSGVYGNAQETGTGGAASPPAQGSTYYLRSVAEGKPFPYLISSTKTGSYRGWYTAEIFPVGQQCYLNFVAADSGCYTTGSGNYTKGTMANTWAYANTGYLLDRNEEPKGDGTMKVSTTGHGKTRYNYAWTMNTDRTVYMYSYPKTYTVSYRANGGSGTMDDSTATYNQPFMTRKNTFSKSGYRFTGWNTAANGSGEAWGITSQNSGTYESGNPWTWTYDYGLTLYAQWETATTYTVTYNANGGSGTMANSYAVYNDPFMTRPFGFTKTGYHFNGYTENDGTIWSTSSYGVYESGNSWVWTYTKNITLTARWAANTYTVNYNGNGATSGSTASSSYEYGTSKKLTKNGFKRVGYTFLGWNKSSTATYAIWDDEESALNLTDVNNGTVTLYAIWKANTYTVSYNANGGTGAPSSQTKTYGVTLTLSSTKPTRANSTVFTHTIRFMPNGGAFSNGSTSYQDISASRISKYTFNNWKSTENATYAPGGSYTLNMSTTMTAQWTTTFSTGSIHFPSVSRAGYRLKGWGTSATSTTATYNDGASYTPTSGGSETLYAIWEPLGRVYISDGTSFSEYQTYIYNGTTWEQYVPYIYDGTNWVLYT